MTKYISKSAVAAEIENRRDSFYSLSKSCEKGTPAKAGFYAQAQTLEGILSFLDTLETNTIETKEVDLEKEYDNEFFKDPVFGKLVNRNAGISIAKHFYELGLKTKGE